MKLLTLAEVTEVVRAPAGTLRYWRWAGTGPKSFKVGRRVMYREQDVAEWLDEQYAEASGGPHAA